MWLPRGYEVGCCQNLQFARPKHEMPWLVRRGRFQDFGAREFSEHEQKLFEEGRQMENNNNFDSSANTDMIEFLDCGDVVARFGDYVDNDLLRVERLAVESHLNDCPECAAFLASYNHVIDSAAELREPEEPISVDVQNRLRKALNQRLGLNLTYIA